MEHTVLQVNTEEKVPIQAGQIPNANSRTIFGNALLTSQFLRNYTNLPIFSDVRPEDIEDVTEHYRAYLGVEFDTDTVKKVRVTIDGALQEVYVIPLIEHKSYVDHDVAMQIFRYMAVIWYTYAKQQNSLHKGISHTKQFRYPLIIPIVYYEGARQWTAGFHLKERIAHADQMDGFVPDFRYHLVNCRDYTNEELRARYDEMSLVMLMNKIQNPGDYTDFFAVSGDYACSVYDKAPEDIKQVYSDIIWSLLMKMKVPVEEAREAIAKLEVGEMGYLFENAEKMDIQAERRNTKEARERAEAAEKKAEAAKQEAEAAKQEANIAKQNFEAANHIRELLIMDVILKNRETGKTKEEMREILCSRYGMAESEAEEKIRHYWK